MAPLSYNLSNSVLGLLWFQSPLSQQTGSEVITMSCKPRVSYADERRLLFCSFRWFLITPPHIVSGDEVLIVFDRFICLHVYVYMFLSLFVSLSKGLRENGRTDLHEISGKVWSDHGKTWLHFERNRAMPRGRGLLCFRATAFYFFIAFSSISSPRLLGRSPPNFDTLCSVVTLIYKSGSNICPPPQKKMAIQKHHVGQMSNNFATSSRNRISSNGKRFCKLQSPAHDRLIWWILVHKRRK